MDNPNQEDNIENQNQDNNNHWDPVTAEITNYEPTQNTAITPTQPVEPTPRPQQPIAPIQPISEIIVPSPPLTLILQWLTYAFWIASTISVVILTGFVAYYFLSGGKDSGSSIAYSIAAVLSFVTFAIICDLLYIKKEPAQKAKGASALMIIHAVIFALGGVGALFTIIFNLVSLMTGENSSYSYYYDNYNSTVSILSAISGLVFCIILFFRTIAIKWVFKLRKIIVIVLTALSLSLVGLGVFGPVVSSVAGKDDKLIENNLSSISNEINNYISAKNTLPPDLNVLSLKGPAKDLVSNNKVTYKPEISSNYSYLRYQLCTTYKNASTSTSYSTNRYEDEYSAYADTNGHPAGNVCYKLEYYYNADTYIDMADERNYLQEVD